MTMIHHEYLLQSDENYFRTSILHSIQLTILFLFILFSILPIKMPYPKQFYDNSDNYDLFGFKDYFIIIKIVQFTTLN